MHLHHVLFKLFRVKFCKLCRGYILRLQVPAFLVGVGGWWRWSDVVGVENVLMLLAAERHEGHHREP